MFELWRWLEEGRAKQAPLMFDEATPVSVKVWICGECMRMAPAIGLQMEYPPTDWKKCEEWVTIPMKPADLEGRTVKEYRQRVFWLECPACKDKEEGADASV